MADSSDETPPTLRIGGWLPEPQHHQALPPYLVPPAGRHLIDVSPPGSPGDPLPSPVHAVEPGGIGRTLVLAAVAVGMVATLALALSPLWSGPKRNGTALPVTPSGVVGGPDLAGLESPTPVDDYSPAPVSLSTRAASPAPVAQPPQVTAPTRQPSHPNAGTTPRPTRTTTPPRPAPSTTPPRHSPKPPTNQSGQDELTPLPASQERSLRSTSNGSSTYIEFVNNRSSRVVVHWLDHNGQRRQYKVLDAHRSYRQQTYVGHPWVVTDERGRALVCFLPASRTKRAVVR
ncbi:hypothetical protein ACIG87_14945 [Micromonospora sp. NPDC051925]|uniref:VHL beta domain-containing protein n=1 Tax=Micromonospora sp. NPDC051925 TaxID=3364288 RepID=UPI0037C4FE0C